MALTIGQLASRAGVNIQTIRYYERRGLMPTPARTDAGYRQYRPEAADRLRFIRRAQELGFSLEEIAELLALRVTPASGCGAARTRAREKLAVVDAKIRDLVRIRSRLERLVTACDAREPAEDCPILEALEEHRAGWR